MSAESRALMSAKAKARPSNRLGKRHSAEVRAKISKITRERTPRGAQCHTYVDGKGAERRGLRYSLQLKRWRYDVFTRDGFTCRECGDGRGGNLQAHHIMPFATYPDLRFNVSNGLTLCWDCHDKKHQCRVRRRRTKAKGQLSLPL